MNKTFEKTLEEIIELLNEGKINLLHNEENETDKHKMQKSKNTKISKRKPKKDKF
jgi:hypothetical protein